MFKYLLSMRSYITLAFVFVWYCSFSQYTGTASVSRGAGIATATNLSTCTGGRVTNVGTITATDNTVWTLPAAVNFTNTVFPFAQDLNNPCNGNNYANTAAAMAAFNSADIVTIDSAGEVITAFVFADNYFEMYINGIPVGKDKVPYTQFNSSVIKFKVKRPFTIAMLLVDWEEHLGLGTEAMGAVTYHDGDAGMVAVFKDSQGNFIAKTDSNWKAQVYYTAPITDLRCPVEVGNSRLSHTCITTDGSCTDSSYGLHWPRPLLWMSDTFNDSNWPGAITYSNAVVGVNNKPSYTNFPDIFDAQGYDAEFIWTSNLVLDNEVLVRYSVKAPTSIIDAGAENNTIHIYPNPAHNIFRIDHSGLAGNGAIRSVSVYNSFGEMVYEVKDPQNQISTEDIPKGIYIVKVNIGDQQLYQRLIVE
jgi:Secretion system C-terminal sorting domain